MDDLNAEASYPRPRVRAVAIDRGAPDEGGGADGDVDAHRTIATHPRRAGPNAVQEPDPRATGVGDKDPRRGVRRDRAEDDRGISPLDRDAVRRAVPDRHPASQVVAARADVAAAAPTDEKLRGPTILDDTADDTARRALADGDAVATAPTHCDGLGDRRPREVLTDPDERAADREDACGRVVGHGTVRDRERRGVRGADPVPRIRAHRAGVDRGGAAIAGDHAILRVAGHGAVAQVERRAARGEDPVGPAADGEASGCHPVDPDAMSAVEADRRLAGVQGADRRGADAVRRDRHVVAGNNDVLRAGPSDDDDDAG